MAKSVTSPSCLLALCMAVCFVAAPILGQEPGEGLRLHIEHGSPSPESSSNTMISVTIYNEGSEMVYILPFLDSDNVRKQRRPHPLNVISFEVTAPDGSKAPHIGEPEYYGRIDAAYPTFCQLLVLPPQSFFGRDVDLARGLFSHQLEQSGTYRIRARYESGVGGWFGRVKESFRDPKVTEYVQSRILDGTITSNEITMDLP